MPCGCNASFKGFHVPKRYSVMKRPPPGAGGAYLGPSGAIWSVEEPEVCSVGPVGPAEGTDDTAYRESLGIPADCGCGCGGTCGCATGAGNAAAGPNAYDQCVRDGGTNCAALLEDEGDAPEDRATMTAARWATLTREERLAWLRTVARSDQEYRELVARTVTGTFDQLVTILRTRADVEIARINADRDVLIARARANADAERDYTGGQRVVPESGSDSYSSGMGLALAAALAFVLAGRR